jgi:RNA polymerase sigma-70 factor (ECF subfamily)
MQEAAAIRPKLLGFAINLTHDVTQAEDLVQQTFLQAYSNLWQFEPGTNLDAWLFTIMRNRWYSDLRKHGREVEFGPALLNSLAVSTGMEESSGEAGYDFRRLLVYIAALPPQHRDALVAVGYLGFSYEEVAKILRCKVGTVKSRVNRARNLLAELMGQAVEYADVTPLKNATEGVPRSDPYYAIAQAYEELYASVIDDAPAERVLSEDEQAWHALVASGALEEREDGLSDLMRGDAQYKSRGV